MSDLKTYLKLHKQSRSNMDGAFRDSFEVTYCEYELSKDLNKNGQAASVLKGGNIRLSIPLLPQEVLMHWLFDTQHIENGEITTHNVQSEVVEKIFFEEARLVEFRFHYESEGINNAATLITINAQRITLGDHEFKNYWR
ncbi:type VI secretion system tube protein TssD [Saccharicrinis fermentans]|uniref:Type VI secretion system needle protein Hcp n=1 Tax=Saccharicrinis fermentans DSM 9555 = JCM 21142 TaxID=869213 RepID=W7YA88_9BACT|nr:type VI secretion system tube protein TssD [Saccharicrinis fermentans]GAF05247.1 hypothetical protein JCM21142_93974 [Saccharicrinis fermentans DSM 9555 = JCM 21142]